MNESFALNATDSFNCPCWTRSPSGRVRSCARHRQVGHSAEIVSHLLRGSTASLGRRRRRCRRRRVSFWLREKQLNVAGFIFGSLNLIFLRLSELEKEMEKEKAKKDKRKESDEAGRVKESFIFYRVIRCS